MEQNANALDRLGNAVQELMDRYQQLETINTTLSQNVTELNEQLSKKQNEIDTINEQYKVLKMAKSLEGASSENKEVKLKINEMVREIDKCIALLNK
ncbi:MAG: hypothetical protein N4A35_14460 [Flavobacteriales bacterium]|jgi:chromosome segregation ATPase|nr:hypothetical protein [Flavobacteriales bacterium]